MKHESVTGFENGPAVIEERTVVAARPGDDFTIFKLPRRRINRLPLQAPGVVQGLGEDVAESIDLVLNPIDAFVDERFQGGDSVDWLRVEEGQHGMRQRVMAPAQIIFRNEQLEQKFGMDPLALALDF